MIKVLVVDDHEKIREAFLFALDLCGYEGVTAANTEEAGRALQQNDFDCIVLDLNLDGESGLSFLKKMRGNQDDTPAVIFSGGITQEIIRTLSEITNVQAIGKEEGVFAVIDKIKASFSSKEV